ncbi:hypothetical protein X749_05255 [Mesorhizobium sp. LNJC391B00]|nr:hypothetical protein X749_05255 [Mesorhizobium sp. LNJC391B00]
MRAFGGAAASFDGASVTHPRLDRASLHPILIRESSRSDREVFPE